MKQMHYNLIDALNCFYREDVITDMLATLINLPESKRKYLLGNETHLRVRNLVKQRIHELADQGTSFSKNITIKKWHTKNAMLTIAFHNA